MVDWNVENKKEGVWQFNCWPTAKELRVVGFW